MVGRYITVPKYEQHAELVQRIISAADGMVHEALRLTVADADQHEFQAIRKSFRPERKT